MKKTSDRLGAKTTAKNQKTKSFINVKMFEPVSKKFTISREADSLLIDYVQYLSASSGRKYNEDSIVEALIEKLHEDKNFKAWLATHTKEAASSQEPKETTV